jgi:hypothetical protein
MWRFSLVLVVTSVLSIGSTGLFYRTGSKGPNRGAIWNKSKRSTGPTKLGYVTSRDSQRISSASLFGERLQEVERGVSRLALYCLCTQRNGASLLAGATMATS